MKNLRRKLSILGAGTTLIGGMALGNFGETYTICEIYQELRQDDSDGSISYIFDPLPQSQRPGFPRLGAKGDDKLKNFLKKENRYCVTVFDSKAPWSPKRITQIE